MRSEATKKFALAGSGLLLRFVLFACGLGLSLGAETPKTHVEFDRDIRPILSENCYACHGPDEKARKAKLHFDTREGAFRLRKDKAVIIPGKSSESELIRRIQSKDPEEQMPPPDSRHKLSDAQIRLLGRWVDQGAQWKLHWAYNKIEPQNVPSTKRKDWAMNPVDRFVLARLEKAGLRPAPEAPRERLIRRVTFDLTGLPPTPEEVSSFLKDHSSSAYPKLVNRLVDSPRFGERVAVEWLDLARYADTYGYQMDAPRAVWPYRDWVIKAFNQKLSYDRFVTWQLAGDLLPQATQEQRLATAFNRLHMQNEEGGVVDEEFRVAYVQDRVDTFGSAFLGVTLQCAHCHDHKFDPISMRDYYSLFAMFQNIDESGQNPFTGFVQTVPAPSLLLTDAATEKRLSVLNSKISALEAEAAGLTGRAEKDFEQWRTKAPGSSSTNRAAWPGLKASYVLGASTNGQVTNLIPGGANAMAHETPKPASGKFGAAAILDGESGFTFPGVGNFSRSDPFSIGLWLRPGGSNPRQVILHHTKAPADAGSRGYELLIEEGHLAFGLHHQWPGNSIKIRSRNILPSNEWAHVVCAYDGSSRAEGLQLFVDGQLQPVETIRDHLRQDITYGGGEPELAIGYRFRDSGFLNGAVGRFDVFDRCLSRLEVSHLAAITNTDTAFSPNSEELSPARRKELLEYYVSTEYPAGKEWIQKIKALRAERDEVLKGVPEIMVMEEMSSPKPAHILKRGSYDSPGDPVYPNTPAMLPPLPAGSPSNRLGLAQWLLNRDNPLFARVAVNRAWQMIFGKGIVETSDNFGAQGATPTHPELLDWLALDFMQTGWDYKRLMKTMVMSATYRQASGPSEDNSSLAQMPPRRLTAEMLRDQALSDGGLLVEKLGGPSVKPYQPAGLWEIAMGNPAYDQGHGPDLYRRSLYTFWKRTVPPPSMLNFDAPERNVCLARRQSTSTPLAALSLMNDTQFVEASRSISQRMFKEAGPDLRSRLTWTFELVTARKPTKRELTVLDRLYEEQLEFFRKDPAAAWKLVAIGEAKPDPGLSPIELAAGTVLAQALLNHDEALMRR